MEIRRFSDLTDGQLNEMLKEALARVSLLEEEKSVRLYDCKKKAWLDLVEMIEEYNKNYGAIIVKGRDNSGYLVDLALEDMNTSNFGFIDVT